MCVVGPATAAATATVPSPARATAPTAKGTSVPVASAAKPTATAGTGSPVKKPTVPGGKPAAPKARVALDAGHVADLEAELADLVKEEAADRGHSKEARVFTQWILSLNIPQLFIHSLVQGTPLPVCPPLVPSTVCVCCVDVGDGLVLIKVLDHLEPGIVNWSRFSPAAVDTATFH